MAFHDLVQVIDPKLVEGVKWIEQKRYRYRVECRVHEYTGDLIPVAFERHVFTGEGIRGAPSIKPKRVWPAEEQ